MTYEQLIDNIMDGIGHLVENEYPDRAALAMMRVATLPGALEGWARRQTSPQEQVDDAKKVLDAITHAPGTHLETRKKRVDSARVACEMTSAEVDRLRSELKAAQNRLNKADDEYRHASQELLDP